MLGTDFIHAPIVKKNSQSRMVVLPEGLWVQLFTGEEYSGGSHNISVRTMGSALGERARIGMGRGQDVDHLLGNARGLQAPYGQPIIFYSSQSTAGKAVASQIGDVTKWHCHM